MIYENFSVKKAAKKSFKKLKKVIKKIGENVRFAPLLPLAPAMLLILKSKGVKVKGDGLDGLVHTFYQTVIKKNFEFEWSDELYFVDPVTTTAIVSAVVNYMKGLKKKQKGKKLTDAEAQAVKSIETAGEKLKDVAVTEAVKTAGEQQKVLQQGNETGQAVSLFANNTPLFVILGIVFLIIIFK